MSIENGVLFALELNKLKLVERAVRVANGERFENPAEHSWQAALLALALAPYAAAPLDYARAAMMLLVHDVGEIDAGDQLVFVATSPDRSLAERSGALRVFGILDPGPAGALQELWEEFETGLSNAAQFAHAIDRALPVLLNLANHGQSWRDNKVDYERVVARVRPPIENGCPALWHYLEPRLAEANDLGYFGEPPAAPSAK